MPQPGPPPAGAATDLRERYVSLFRTPDLLPWQLDLSGSRLLLALLDEDAYRSAAFLDQRLNLDGRLQAIWAPLKQVSDDARASGRMQVPAGFLFHIGHCGSTLLTRLLGEDPRLLPLREPLSLRMLAESERLAGTSGATLDRPAWEALRELLLLLLTRSYREDQRALIKPSSNCNNLMEPVLASHPGHKAVFLYLNLRSYLANVLRPQSRNALYVFANDRSFDLRRFMPGIPVSLDGLAPARLGALNWTASMAQLLQVRDDPRFSGRVRPVGFEDFLRDPAASLVELSTFLGMPMESAQAQRVLAGGHMQRYAKDLRFPYTPELREEDLRHSLQVHAQDIDDAQAWLTGMLERTPGLAGLQEMLTAG